MAKGKILEMKSGKKKKDGNGEKTAEMLKAEVAQEKSDRRRKFTLAMSDIMKQYRCRIIGIPRFEPTAQGWTIMVDIDAVAEQ